MIFWESLRDFNFLIGRLECEVVIRKGGKTMHLKVYEDSPRSHSWGVNLPLCCFFREYKDCNTGNHSLDWQGAGSLQKLTILKLLQLYGIPHERSQLQNLRKYKPGKGRYKGLWKRLERMKCNKDIMNVLLTSYSVWKYKNRKNLSKFYHFTVNLIHPGPFHGWKLLFH